MRKYKNFDDDSDAGDDHDSLGKVVLAALAGATAGAVVGLLFAPDKGANTVAALKAAAGRYGEQLEEKLKNYAEKVEELADSAGAGASLMLKGDWNDLKGQLKSRYADLTDEDLTYAEGKADELVGGIQRRLGKTKREVIQMLNDLG